ncbi:MAG: inorganic phosphate transporter, partial [Methylophilaceae bacterium]
LEEPHHQHHVSIFFLLLLLGISFTVYNLYADVLHDAPVVGHLLPFILLAIALFIALAFEFVNGFHDTANAVATVIYTHSLSPNMAVIWSGIFNFIGVMLSSGIVAYSIIALLPVELILQVGSRAGFAMVFALLLSAILWNLGTWWLGLPASSSHTMVGSIIGIGMANAWIKGNSATAGVDWAHAHKVMVSLLISPLIGFLSAAALLIIAKRFIKNRDLYHAPKGKAPPPLWIRCLLILTCTGVSFAHGSNDGQKGMGLIMLILVGTVPTVYALNKAIPDSKQGQFIAIAQQTEQTLHEYQTP